MDKKYQDIMISPAEASAWLERQGFAGHILERHVKRFNEDPHTSSHLLIATYMISVAAETPQHLGDVYFAVRDLADRLDPPEFRRMSKTPWQLRRDAANIKTGIEEEEYEKIEPRPDPYDELQELRLR